MMYQLQGLSGVQKSHEDYNECCVSMDLKGTCTNPFWCNNQLLWESQESHENLSHINSWPIGTHTQHIPVQTEIANATRTRCHSPVRTEEKHDTPYG
jgi:hypothetical protein